MKKKAKQKSSASATTTSAELKTLIREHSLFFDELIELIPAKFYLPNDDADSKPWYQGLSKAAKASLKQQSRENLKLARRNRLDPDKLSQSSTLDLLNQSLHKTIPSQDDIVDPQANPPVSLDDTLENRVTATGDGCDVDGDNNGSVTYEELREKLRKKIESLRGNRGGGGEKRNENKRNQDKKRKRSEDDEKNVEGNAKKGEKVEEEGIEYGKVKIGDEEKRKNKKKRKMSREKELERAKRLDEVKRENPYVAEKESWKAATSRAMGEKVHDDPRLLKESLKKEKKRREKNASKWKERVERTEKMKEERQEKRKNNIADRAREKKARKIAKREKKLLRPGFEGRKEGYITKD